MRSSCTRFSISESVCGAYRFTIRARDETIIDVEGTIIARAALDHVGYAAIAGMYLFGPASHRIDDDARPAVHDVGGLQLRTGRANGYGGRSPIRIRCKSRPSSTKIRVASGCCNAIGTISPIRTTTGPMSAARRSGSSLSAIGVKAPPASGNPVDQRDQREYPQLLAASGPDTAECASQLCLSAVLDMGCPRPAGPRRRLGHAHRARRRRRPPPVRRRLHVGAFRR